MTKFTTSSRGDRIAYDLRGSGPALVFVAGAGPFRAIDQCTTETAERAGEAGLTTLVFDRLGRGESGGGGVLDLPRELEALRAVIDVVGGSAMLCGHSSGCAIALRAATVGLPVTGLVLWEAPLAQPAAATTAWTAEIERRMDAEDFVGAMEHFMKDMPPQWLAEVQASPQWAMIAAGVTSQRADAQALAWAQTALETGGLGGLTVPVLATYGTQTFPEMPTAAALIADVVPGTSVKEIPGADHAWQPEPMAAELVAFARRRVVDRCGSQV
ncbi:MAG: alpha/beta fold hydrolase [Propionibacteriaceae bacterium]